MVPETRALALLFAAALVAGLARGFSGFGGALIFVPLAAAAVGPRVAAPLLLLVDSVAVLGLLPGAWRRAERREVGAMLAGAVVGAPAGAAILALADPDAIRWCVSVLVLALLAVLVSGWRYRGTPRLPLTVGVGTISGFLSGVAQTGGPPVVAYWIGRDLPGAVVRANLLLFSVLSGVVAGVSYGFAGLMTRQVLLLTLMTAPLYGLGLVVGSRLFGLASERTYRRLCYALIALAAMLGAPVLDAVLR